MRYYTTSCPYCGRTLQRRKTSLNSVGCPIKHCPRCGNPYVDQYCREPALKPYSENTILSNFIVSLFYSFLYSFISFLIFSLIAENDGTDLRLFGTLIVFFAIFLLIFLYSCITLKRTNKRSLDEWLASEARLNNKQYAFFLYASRFEIPEKYMPKPEEVDEDFAIALCAAGKRVPSEYLPSRITD